jgi:hypothetical protein
MTPSSRTPEGRPNRCPVCGQAVVIEPSAATLDAPCPACGHLLWFAPSFEERLEPLVAWSMEQQEAAVAKVERQIRRVDAAVWMINGILIGLLIAAVDRSLLGTVGWAAFCGWFGRTALPKLENSTKRLFDRRPNFWCEAACGWALVPGPLVGSAFGALLTFAWQLPLTIWQGALLGLIVGPVLAVLEGLVVVTLAVAVHRLVTGKRLDAA